MSFSGLESLKKGLIHTDISPTTARWMVGLFVAALVFVPLGQLGYELLRHKHVQELNVLRPPRGVAWRAGEASFPGRQRCGDGAQDVGGWQWVAGFGPDAGPDFRVLSPVA